MPRLNGKCSPSVRLKVESCAATGGPEKALTQRARRRGSLEDDALLGSHVPYGFFDGGGIVDSRIFVAHDIEFDFLAILKLELKTVHRYESLSLDRSQLSDLEVDRGRVNVDGGATQNQTARLSLPRSTPMRLLDPTGKSRTFRLLIRLGRLLGGD